MHDIRHIHRTTHHGRGPHGHGHGRGRARRGAVGGAILRLLDERPMHGYELIAELDARSEGRWRPSPGAIYPALGRLEEAGLIAGDELDGKRVFRLTDLGRARLHDQAAEPAPWEAGAAPRGSELRRALAELVGPARQIGRFGSADQIERAATVLSEATRSLYQILASPAAPAAGATPSPDDPATGATGPTEV
ncbi:MAG: PadR family transcriptional regulator [Ilumatobacteraceae bacterium]|jgi:DNA-binding PadR family transcriptional regulator|nr:PadR family transcriptional regulator [Ilumatobacteraceae bacterium]